MNITKNIIVNEVRISYSVHGRGTPVILLHGWSCNQKFWKNQIGPLSKDHQVFAPDFRGHGLSEVPDDGYTLAGLAEDIHLMIENLNLPPTVVIGHSMGGMVAQQLAITHPNDVSALGLIATVASDPKHELVSARIEAQTPEIGYLDALTRHFPTWFSENATSGMREWSRAQMTKTPERVALAMTKDYKNLDFREELPKLRIPTLVVGASFDYSTTVIRSEEIANLIPNAKLVVIPNSGHFVQLEQPDKISQIISTFIREFSL